MLGFEDLLRDTAIGISYPLPMDTETLREVKQTWIRALNMHTRQSFLSKIFWNFFYFFNFTFEIFTTLTFTFY